MENKVAVVVGVGPGLGSALVRRLAAESFSVHAAARDVTRLQALAAETGCAARVQPHACDATVPGDVERLFAAVAGAGPAPELVVFNVGTLERGRVLELAPQRFEVAWRTITLGGLLVGQAAARLMVEADRGTIIFTGATSALRGKEGFAASAAARAGLRMLAQSMARELGPRGIHVVHVVVDGGIFRPEYAAALRDRPPDALLDPAAIAEAYLALHRQHRSAWTQELDLRPWVEKF